MGRGKHKHTTSTSMKDYYEHYCVTTFKEGRDGRKGKIHWDSPYCVDASTFGKVVKEFNKLISEEMIYATFDYKLPFNMGVLGIRKEKNKLRFDSNGKLKGLSPVDWKSTLDMWENNPDAKEAKKLIRHENTHTGGFIYKWYYNKRKASYKYRTVYKFKPSRTNARELAKVLKDPNINVDFYTF